VGSFPVLAQVRTLDVIVDGRSIQFLVAPGPNPEDGATEEHAFIDVIVQDGFRGAVRRSRRRHSSGFWWRIKRASAPAETVRLRSLD
jgi:hypothetical protein